MANQQPHEQLYLVLVMEAKIAPVVRLVKVRGRSYRQYRVIWPDTQAAIIGKHAAGPGAKVPMATMGSKGL